LLPATSAAQDYPARPVTLLVPWSAGGPTDIAVRALGDALSKQLNQRVLIENRPGSGGAMAAQQMAASAKPDGYTLAQLPLGVFRLPHMIKTSFDPISDLTWIANIAGYDFGVSVRADSPLKTWNDLIAFVRANPGKLAYSSPGVGTSLHLTMDDLMARLKLNWLHVPYKGSAGVLNDVMGGQIAVTIDNMPPYVPQVRAGKIRALAVSTAKRSSAMPDLPSIAEAGVPGYDAGAWFGLLAPAGTPRAVVDKLSAETARILKLPEVSKRISELGAEPVGGTPEQFAAFIKSEIDKWAKVIKDANVELQ